jgi:predicted transcriptional regulator of viral defense system
VEEQVRRAVDFFESNPVFRHEEFVAAHTGLGRSPTTSNNLLAKHIATGRLLRIRKGLYATVPRGVSAAVAQVDPYLVASRLTPDAVVAFHAALQFHGKTYSVWRRVHYLTNKRTRPFTFRGEEFVPVQAPASVRHQRDFGGGVVTLRHAGGEARVTTLERTMVDVLGAPERSGGWEEVWRSLEMVEYFDLSEVTEHVRALFSALTAARVGYFLDQHREALMVEERHLEPLRALAPRQPRYLDSVRTRGRLVADWNLIVPEKVEERRWEEPE